MGQSSLGRQLRGLMGIVSGTLGVLSANISHAAPIEAWQYDSNVNLLTFVLPDGVMPSYFLMAQPARIVLDIPNTQMGTLPATQNYSSGAIEQISVFQVQPQLMRVVLQMSPDAVFARGQAKLVNVGDADSGKDRWVLQPLLSSSSVAQAPVPQLQPQVEPQGSSQRRPQAQTPAQTPAPAAPASPVQSSTSSSPLMAQGSDLPATLDPNSAPNPAPNVVAPPSAADYPPGMVPPAIPSSASNLLTPLPPPSPAQTPGLPQSSPQPTRVMDGLAALTALPPTAAPVPSRDRPTVTVPPLASITSAAAAPLPPAPATTPNSTTPKGQALSPTAVTGLLPTPPQQGTPAAAQPARTSAIPGLAQTTVPPAATTPHETMPFPDPTAASSMPPSPLPPASNPSASFPPLPSTPQRSNPVGFAPSMVVPVPPVAGMATSPTPASGAVPPLPSAPQSGGQQMLLPAPLPTTPQSISSGPTSGSIPFPVAPPTAPQPASLPTAGATIQFGQPIPASETIAAPATVETIAAPAMIVAMNQANTGLLVVPAGSVLNLQYAGTQKLKLASGAVPEVLLLQTPIQDSSGRTIVPKGSAVLGQFQTDQTGSRFVSQVLSVGGRNFLLVGQSAALNESRQVSTGKVLQNSGIGAAAGAILGAFTGGIGALVVGGAAAGAATTYATSPQEAVVEPGAVLPVRLTQELLTSR